MESFWKEHSKKATEEEMMLDSHAEELGKEEIPEVLALLPSVDQLDVLELGAGIGYVYLFVCLSVCVRILTCMYVCMSTCISVLPSVYVSMLSVCMSVC